MILRAYKISCADDDHGMEVAFAERAKDARQMRSGDTCDCGFIEIKAHRAPEFDSYAPGPVPIEAMLKAGWNWSCMSCERYVYDDTPGKVIVGEYVFCNEACRQKCKADMSKYPESPSCAELAAIL